MRRKRIMIKSEKEPAPLLTMTRCLKLEMKGGGKGYKRDESVDIVAVAS